MREALFIKKNKDRWTKVQEQVSEDPDETATDFIQLVDDLAYAKTFYPAGKVTSYINTQASKFYLEIYKNRKEESNRLLTFWKYDLPLVINKHYKICWFAFLLFLLFFVIGFFTSRMDEGVARSFMGDGYVDMTKENIKKGNPFGVYETGSMFLDWMGIMINNIKVGMIVFVGGLFFAIPALYKHCETGVMLGIFNQLFADNGYGLDFWLVVFVHGTLEITALIFSSAAGIILGTSFIFPGTIKRIDAFKQGAKDGIKLMIGMLPIFVIAAFFESYITRLYNNHSWLTTAVFGVSVLFVIWYFVVWPIVLGRRAATFINEEVVK